MDHLDQEYQVRRDRLVLLDLQVPLDRAETMENVRVTRWILAPLEPMVQMAPLDHQVHQGLPEFQAPKEIRGMMELPDPLEPLDHRDLREFKESKDLLDLKVPWELLEMILR